MNSLFENFVSIYCWDDLSFDFIVTSKIEIAIFHLVLTRTLVSVHLQLFLGEVLCSLRFLRCKQ